MLVLTRKAEQKIRIGPNIIITILEIEGRQVSIGIDAPKDLDIMREELILSECTTHQPVSFKNDN